MERRTRRANTLTEALTNFFDALCLKRSLDAVALTTSDGLLIAGSGTAKANLEELGAIGAMKRVATPFGKSTLHVSRFDVNDVDLCLTTLGAPIRDDAAIGSLMRILAV